MILDDHRLKVRDLSEGISNSVKLMHCLWIENLTMRKLCARWIPSLLTIEQIQRHEVVSKGVGPPLYMWEKGIVRVLDLKGRVVCMDVKDNSICWQGHDLYFFEIWHGWLLLVIFTIEYIISRGCYANLLQKKSSHLARKDCASSIGCFQLCSMVFFELEIPEGARSRRPLFYDK